MQDYNWCDRNNVLADEQNGFRKERNCVDHILSLVNIKSLYSELKCAVLIHGNCSEWFDVNVGLRQGCLLSPLLFNMYINDLIADVKGNCSGFPIGGVNVCAFLYADDLVFLARNERDLQAMLDRLHEWCMKYP